MLGILGFGPIPLGIITSCCLAVILESKACVETLIGELDIEFVLALAWNS
jgi:hypothetical protein